MEHKIKVAKEILGVTKSIGVLNAAFLSHDPKFYEGSKHISIYTTEIQKSFRFRVNTYIRLEFLRSIVADIGNYEKSSIERHSIFKKPFY